MPVSPRATELRAELESILGVPVAMTVQDDGAHLRVPAPPGGDLDGWQRVISALHAADRWGSSDHGDAPEIWAHVTEGHS